MLHICYPCEKFNPGQNFRFQRKGSLTKHQKLPECIRNQFLYNRLQSSSVSKRKSKFMETTTQKLLKHEFDIPPVMQMENESSASANVTLLEENENHMLTVVGSRSERVDEELFYFINADQSTDISQAVNQQNIEGLTGDLCIINYQERFFKELYRTNVLHIKCIYSFVEKLLEYQHHSRRSNCSIEKQCDIIKIIGFANKYSLSNEGGKELLEIINNIYTRYDAEGTIPGTLNGIKNSVFNDMSHYNYETIQVHWFEDWNIDVIGIMDPLDIHLRNPIELISELMVDPEIMFKWKDDIVFDYVLNTSGVISDIMTSPWSKYTQDDIRKRDPSGHLLPIILYADGIALNNNIHNQITPVICTIGNFSNELITQDISKCTISYIPNLKKINEGKILKHLQTIYKTKEEACKQMKLFHMQVTRTVWEYIVNIVNHYWLNGVNMHVLGQGVKCFYPCVAYFAGDLPQQHEVVGVREKGRYGCTYCMYDTFACAKYNAHSHISRHYDNIYNDIKRAEVIANKVSKKMLIMKHEERILNDINLKCIHPILSPFHACPFGYNTHLFNFTGPDLLHVFCGGLMKSMAKFVLSIVYFIGHNKLFDTKLQSNNNRYHGKHITFDDRIDRFPRISTMPHLNWTRFKGGILRHHTERGTTTGVLHATGSFGGFRSTSFISLMFQILYALGNDVIPDYGTFNIRNNTVTIKNPGKKVKLAIILLLDVYFECKRKFWDHNSINSLQVKIHKLYDCYILVWDLLHEMYNTDGVHKRHRIKKLHNIMHIPDFIRMKGSCNGPNTDHFERHNRITKAIWNKTSRRHETMSRDMLQTSIETEHNRRLHIVSKLNDEHKRASLVNEFNNNTMQTNLCVLTQFGIQKLKVLNLRTYEIDTLENWTNICCYTTLNTPEKLMKILSDLKFSDFIQEEIDNFNDDCDKYKSYFAFGVSYKGVSFYATPKFNVNTRNQSNISRYDFVMIKEDWTQWTGNVELVLARILLFIVFQRNDIDSEDPVIFCVVQTLKELNLSAREKQLRIGKAYTWQRDNMNKNFVFNVVNITSVEQSVFVVPEYRNDHDFKQLSPNVNDIFNVLPLHFFDRDGGENTEDDNIKSLVNTHLEENLISDERNIEIHSTSESENEYEEEVRSDVESEECESSEEEI